MNSHKLSSKMRRIIHESEKTDLWTLGEEQGIGVVYCDKNGDFRKCFLVDIFFPADYPFKPPALKIHNTSVSVLSLLRPSAIATEIKEISDMDCLCCAYAECQNNWSPSITIDNVITQLSDFLKIKKRALERYLCKRIAEKNNIPAPPHGPAIEDFL